MQKWEYKILHRVRSYEERKTGFLSGTKFKGSDWICWLDGKKQEAPFLEVLTSLGDQGWELVGMEPRSSWLSDQINTIPSEAGFTTDDTWVFKRPKD